MFSSFTHTVKDDVIDLYTNNMSEEKDGSGNQFNMIGKMDITGLDNALASAPPLMCPRNEDDDIGDDMSEVSEPPGWSELSKEEKLDILDWQMDEYWREIEPPVNWWKVSTFFMVAVNIALIMVVN